MRGAPLAGDRKDLGRKESLQRPRPAKHAENHPLEPPLAVKPGAAQSPPEARARLLRGVELRPRAGRHLAPQVPRETNAPQPCQARPDGHEETHELAVRRRVDDKPPAGTKRAAAFGE